MDFEGFSLKILKAKVMCSAVLIANLRTLFCRIPSRGITRSPWAARPAHLCWFAVRYLLNSIVKIFLGRMLL